MGYGLKTLHADASRAEAARAVRRGGWLKGQSKYKPHQGKQEMVRRVRQMGRVG